MKSQIDLIKKYWFIIVFLSGLIGQWYMFKSDSILLHKHLDASEKLVQEMKEFKGAHEEFKNNVNERFRSIERRLNRGGR